jgi:thiol-disulfide isomerase/thioredoxin
MMGLTLDLPAVEWKNWTVLYGPFSQEGEAGEYDAIDGSSLFFMPMVSGATIFEIRYYAEPAWDAWISDGMTPDEITGTANSEELGRVKDVVYIYSQPEPDESGMSDEAKAEYRRVLDMVPRIKASITLSGPPTVSTEPFPAFKTTDMYGNPVDSSIFADNTLTMINFWGTFCGPCIDEMPGLADMSANMPEGTAIVGIVIDAVDERRVELAKKIADETGVSYTNILPDSVLFNYTNDNIIGVPTTVYVDSAGNIVDSALIGARSAEMYMSELLARLDKLP